MALYINLKDLDDRITTFEDWPVDFLDPKKLAAAGLYYTKQQDKVRCAYCSLEMEGWVPGDDPVKNHMRLSPTCPFLDSMYQEHVKNQDIATLTFGQFEIFGNQPNLDIYFNAPPPAYYKYRTHQSRLDSFLTWPKLTIIKPEILASAGLFYTGAGDETICFHCGGGLKDWEVGDDPIVEHAKHFKQCNYIAAIRGVPLDAEDAICGELSVISINDDKSKKREETPSQALLCKICCKEELAMVFLPCGHLFSCVKCAFSLDNCGICRKSVVGFMRVYLA